MYISKLEQIILPVLYVKLAGVVREAEPIFLSTKNDRQKKICE